MRFKKSQHRRDLNEQEIVDALEAAGALVYRTGCVGNGFPDLVVSRGHGAERRLMEVKMPGKGLTEAQVKFWEKWGDVIVVHSVEEALLAVWG